jgi:hypothetical protein
VQDCDPHTPFRCAWLEAPIFFHTNMVIRCPVIVAQLLRGLGCAACQPMLIKPLANAQLGADLVRGLERHRSMQHTAMMARRSSLAWASTSVAAIAARSPLDRLPLRAAVSAYAGCPAIVLQRVAGCPADFTSRFRREQNMAIERTTIVDQHASSPVTCQT